MNHRTMLLQALVRYQHESRAAVVAGSHGAAPTPETVNTMTSELVSRAGGLALAARRKRAVGLFAAAVLIGFSFWGFLSEGVAYWVQYVGAVVGFLVLVVQVTQSTRAVTDLVMVERLLRTTLADNPERLHEVVGLLISVLRQK